MKSTVGISLMMLCLLSKKINSWRILHPDSGKRQGVGCRCLMKSNASLCWFFKESQRVLCGNMNWIVWCAICKYIYIQFEWLLLNLVNYPVVYHLTYSSIFCSVILTRNLWLRYIINSFLGTYCRLVFKGFKCVWRKII